MGSISTMQMVFRGLGRIAAGVKVSNNLQSDQIMEQISLGERRNNDDELREQNRAKRRLIPQQGLALMSKTHLVRVRHTPYGVLRLPWLLRPEYLT